MEVYEKMTQDIHAALKEHFGTIDTSQKQLKALLLGLDAKVDALARSSNGQGIYKGGSTASSMGPTATNPPKSILGGGSVSKQSRNAVGHLSSTFSDQADIVHITSLNDAAHLMDRAASATSVRTLDSAVRPMNSMQPISSMRSLSGGEDDEECAQDQGDDRDFLPLRPSFKDLASKRGASTRPRPSNIAVPVETEFDFGAHDTVNLGRSRWKAWSPDARPRRLLDIMGMVLVLYDSFMVPFWLAWDFTWPVGFWTTLIFWTIDVPTQFVTGYRRKDARLELDLTKAALYYIKTWFLLDFTIVLCDWIAALSDASFTLRYLRVMRLVRGGRQVLRFFLALQQYKLSSQFLEVHLLTDIALLLAFILWVNHVVCCGWYWVGSNVSSDTGWTWVREAGVTDVGMPYEYSTSLHWALTQMTPASMEVVPECTAERFLNVVIILCGLILGSVFAATLTSSMTQYRLYKERVSNNFMQLQSFLAQQGIEPELSMAVKVHVKQQLRMRQRLHWSAVAYLEYASKSLKETLWHACCMKCIRRHAFLHCLNLFDSSAINALCNGAMITVTYSRGDIVFEVGAGSKDGRMHFLVIGGMFYDPGMLSAEADLPREDPRLHLVPGTFVSEASLWVEWNHLGTLFVESISEVLQLNSVKLSEALSHRFPDVMAIVVQYSVAFHASLHDLGGVRSDLGGAVDNLDLMTALETPVRLGLAEPILEQLRSKRNFSKGITKDFNNMENEIQEGRCGLGFEDDEPVRTVFVVALKLWKTVDDDRFLVKVGEVNNDSGMTKPCCVLPGTKRKGKETSGAAIGRLFDSEFVEFKESIKILPNSCTKTAFLKSSPTYGVRTRYLRTTYEAALNDSCEMETAGADWNSTGSFENRPERRRISMTGTISHDSSFGQMHDKGCPSVVSSCLGTLRNKLKKCCRSKSDSLDGQDARAKFASEAQIRAVLSQQDSAVVLATDPSNRQKSTVNIWVTQEEFGVLSSELATPFIHSWLRAVRFEEAEADGAADASKEDGYSLASSGKGSVASEATPRIIAEQPSESVDVDLDASGHDGPPAAESSDANSADALEVLEL